jgi:putative transposase
MHQQRFETSQHASRVISDGVGLYNTRRPHSAKDKRMPLGPLH